MQVFAVKIINIMLAVSLVCTYNAVVNDRKEQETAARQKLAEQQAQAAENTAAPASPYADGTYTGEAQGYGGPVKMEVTIEHGQITDCTVLSAEKEDTAYFDAAQGVIDEVLDEQTAEVDTVSGATFSSRGILGAVEDALEQATIQLLFFLFLPSAFTTAFSGIKSVLTQIGTGSPVVMSSFLTVLLALCAYTVVFGRFFCGYACAFGTLGDAVHALYLFLCKKCRKKPVLLKKSWKKPLSFLKYAVLLAIVLLCFTGIYGEITGWSPWDVFSMLRSGNFKVGAYWLGCVLLVLILAGMVFCERFFCRFLCPMGAVFTMLPVLPFFSVRRQKANCAKGCTACQKICPSDLELPEKGSWNGNGDCFQCQKCLEICPKKNAESGFRFFRGNEIWFAVLRAVILAAVLILAGI